jgi:sugar O-acyltransferase (sialic acid O-acetyltransferase NeuD family)
MNGRLRCVLLGAGGHAKVIIEALRGRHPEIDLCVLRARGGAGGSELMGVPVVGDDGDLPRLLADGVRFFAVGLGAVGDNRPRAALFRLAIEHGLQPLSVQHPSAIVSPSATLAAGCQVLAGAVVGTDAQLGANVIVNSRAVVEHDCRLGEHAHVASGAVLAGGVTVGAGAHVGAGAVVKQGLRIGSGAIVGAGAAVIDDVADGQTVVGVPARPIQRPMQTKGAR